MTSPEEERPPGRLAAGRSRAQEARRELGERLVDARGRWGAVDGLARAWEHDSRVGGGLLAGALAFRLFLFMVPFVMVVFTLLGATARVADASPDDVARQAGISGLLAKGIFTTDSLTPTHQTFILLVGGWALFTASRSVVATMSEAHCLAWRIPKQRMRRMTPALVFILFVLVTSVLSSYLARLRAEAPAPGVVLTVAWIALPLLAWWWASSRLPHADAPTWALLPGAVLFAVGLQAAHVFTVVWVSRSIENNSETYGVLGVSLSVLAWAYVIGRLVIGTAVLNAALWRRFCEVHPEATDGVGPTLEAPSRLDLLRSWVRSAAGLLR